MSGSSRHGSPRSAAAGRPGTGRPAGARRGDDRAAGGRAAQGRALPPVDAAKVAEIVEPVVGALGMDLEGVRVSQAGRRRLLRLVVDADGGISLDDIAVASRELSAALDDSAVMGDLPYTLEVSSPGVDRPLTERRHWRRAIGRLVTVPLAQVPGEAVTGRVTGASADQITLDVDGESRGFGYGDLGPGRIQVEFAQIADAAAGDDDAGDSDEARAYQGGAGEDWADAEGADEEGPDGH